MNNIIQGSDLQLKELQSRYEKLKQVSTHTISELECRCDSYQKEIENVDLVCHMLRQDNLTLRDQLEEAEEILSETQSSARMEKLLAERTINELQLSVTSLKYDMKRLKDTFADDGKHYASHNYSLSSSAIQELKNNRASVNVNSSRMIESNNYTENLLNIWTSSSSLV